MKASLQTFDAAVTVVAAVDCVAAVAIVSVRALLVFVMILLLPGFPLVQGLHEMFLNS